jgi:anti-sigma-K factor RskA
MNHPREVLPDYVLGLLDNAELEQVERHLETCQQCQAEVYQLNEGLLQVTRTVPTALPSERTWAAIREGIRSAPKPRPATSKRRYAQPRWAWAALSLTVLIVGLLGYNTIQERTRRENLESLLSSLTHIDQVRRLELSDGSSLGRAFLSSREHCLIVFDQPAPTGQVYQVWGYQNGVATSLGVFSGTSTKVTYTGYEEIGISVEPPEGSVQPTQELAQFSL